MNRTANPDAASAIWRTLAKPPVGCPTVDAVNTALRSSCATWPGLSTEEAAEVMGLSEAAFKSRLHRARLALRRALDEHFLEAGE